MKRFESSQSQSQLASPEGRRRCSPTTTSARPTTRCSSPAAVPRAHCRALAAELEAASPEDLALRQVEADRAFLTQGITFTVYGDEQGTERIFPFDLLPRIITAPEWGRSSAA